MGSVEIANLRSEEIASNPDWYIRFLQYGLFGGIRGLHPAGLQGNGFQLFTPEAFALNVEYRGIIKDPVQGTQQGIVLIEVASPVRGVLVAGEYNIEVALLVVPPVNQIKEQAGILLAKFTVPYLVNNQTGRTHKAIQYGCFLSCTPGSGELVPQLGHLNEVSFNASLAALITECLCQMGLAGSRRANECKVSVSIDGR